MDVGEFRIRIRLKDIVYRDRYLLVRATPVLPFPRLVCNLHELVKFEICLHKSNRLS